MSKNVLEAQWEVEPGEEACGIAGNLRLLEQVLEGGNREKISLPLSHSLSSYYGFSLNAPNGGRGGEPGEQSSLQRS